MPTTLNSGLQLPDKGSVDWYSSMQTNYNLLDNHLENTDTHVTAEDKANWNSKQGSLSQAQLDAIAQVAANTSDIATLQSGKANASHTHSSSDITDIGDYATKQYVDNSISGLVDSAPNALDTLNELAAALNDDANFATTVTNALSAKANSADLATVATSGSYNDLSNKPTINDSTITIQKNGSLVGTFTVNGSAKTIDIPVPTKTSDLTNDSNFVDTSNSAVASGITSAKVTSYDSHIADTDIHVTTADKTKWNTIALVKQLRLVNIQVGSSTTIAFANIDDINGIKVGDKCMDLDAKMFEITAVDTTNQTVTVGTALINLALDGNVVHLSGSETITGAKYFNGIIYSIGGIQTRLSTQVTSGESSSKSWAFIDNAYKSLFKLVVSTNTDKSTRVEHVIYNVDSNNTETLNRITWRFDNNSSVSELRPTDNAIKLGTSLYRWSEVYATNYYYGSNNVEFSTKFVTTDTTQSITAVKTITDANLELKSTSAEYGVSAGDSSIIFKDKNNRQTFKIYSRVFSSGVNNNLVNFFITQMVDNIYYSGNGIQLHAGTNDKNVVLRPILANNNADGLSVSLGSSDRKWKDVQTNLVNGLTPSSLSLPDFSNRVDITGYISNLSGNTNNYTPPVNGWLYVGSNDASYLALFDTGSGGCGIRFSDGVVGEKYACIPCQANRTLGVRITCTNLAHAYFVPCLGNI